MPFLIKDRCIVCGKTESAPKPMLSCNRIGRSGYTWVIHNEDGDMLGAGSTRSRGNSFKDACPVILKDKHRRYCFRLYEAGRSAVFQTAIRNPRARRLRFFDTDLMYFT